jgi:hypothetical protein
MELERKIEDIIESLGTAKDRPNKCTILIGAGCSVKADIPLASGFVKIIEEDHNQAYKRAAEKTYPKCMAELAGGERRELIARYINQAKINWAHIAIAQLMKAGYIDRVLTVNFDPLVVKACAMVGLYPAVYDFAARRGCRWICQRERLGRDHDYRRKQETHRKSGKRFRNWVTRGQIRCSGRAGRR